MKNKLNSILIVCLLIFLSCETEGQITGTPSEPESWQSIGDSPGNGDFYSVKDFYFDFNSTNNYNKEFWKFDFLDFQATSLEYSHCGPSCNGEQDIFTLSTFHNSYYIPPEAFDLSNIIYVQNEDYDPNNPNDPNNLEYIPFDLSTIDETLLGEELIEEEDAKKSEDFTLATPNLSSADPISGMTWDASQNPPMYSISTVIPIRDTINYSYEYDYQIKENFVVLDTIKNPRIPNHMYIIDPTEISDSIRSYILYDSLSVPSSSLLCDAQNTQNTCDQIEICSWEENTEECVIYTPPITIDREYDFYGYINDINDDFGFRKTTDCNDNYQQDPSELTMSDFESSCSGDFSLNNTSCSSTCGDSFGNIETMDEWCWNQLEGMERLTGRCVEGQTLVFCDTGNALYDQEEFLYDQDGNNLISIVSGTQQNEPFEDRNCNNSWDGNSEDEVDVNGVPITNKADCLEEYFTSWDEYHSKCFYDTGNGQWDDIEECHSDDGQICDNYGDPCNCNYRDLYERGLAPSYLIVSYADEINPVPKTDIFPSDIFADCGSDALCDKSEIVNGGFDSGICIVDNYSGSKEDCCKYNFCWNYTIEDCDFTVADCNPVYVGIDDIWTENFDPAGDNCTNCDIDNPSSNFNGTEKNFQWDTGEEIKQNFDDIAGYSDATTYLTKFLPYSDENGMGISCSDYDPYAGNEPPVLDNCGGNTIEIISSEFKKGTAITSFQKHDSEVYVSSFDIIAQIPETITWLTNLDIVKTQWPSDNAQDGNSEDYMLFLKNEESIIKLIQPYYYFANTPGSGTGTDYIDYDASQWWQAFDWERDILIPSMDMEDESTLDTSYTVYSNVANYEVTKEYQIKKDYATMTYSETVEDCILLTRIVTIEMIGPGPYFKVMSETWLKDDDETLGNVRLVKERISWIWNPPYGANTDCDEGDDRLGCGLNWTKISSIEYKGEFDFSSNGQNLNPARLENIEDLPGFNGDPFRLSNTMGMQRVIAPPMD